MALQEPTTLALAPVCPFCVALASSLINTMQYTTTFDTSQSRPSHLAWSVGLFEGDRPLEEKSTGMTTPSTVVPAGRHGRAHCANVGQHLPG